MAASAEKADRQLAPQLRTLKGSATSELMHVPRLAILAFVLLDACSATDVTQSQWEPSPTGAWLTRTVREDTSGPGNSYLSETVQVRNVAADEPVDVLTLEELNGPASIKLRWLDPAHLEVAYANGKVVFQAVRVGDLRIDAAGVTSKGQ